jgi:hypothetical protein
MNERLTIFICGVFLGNIIVMAPAGSLTRAIFSVSALVIALILAFIKDKKNDRRPE